MELTRDAEKMICIIYKEYLTRRKNGVPKNQAKQFNDFETWSKDLFPNELTEDVKATSCEMCKAFGIRMYMNCGFILNDAAIIYMENRFKNGISEVLSFLAQFIP